MNSSTLSTLSTLFGDRMQENAPLSGYTSARIGGPADALVFIHSEAELVQAVEKLWELAIPFVLVGGGSNMLVSDRGVRGVVLVNRARLVKFDSQAEPPTVRAESGATLNDIAQRAARLGLADLEWAASIPGSLGGAVYGNAGAFGGEMAGNLVSVELLFKHGRETWPVEKMDYGAAPRGLELGRRLREHGPEIRPHVGESHKAYGLYPGRGRHGTAIGDHLRGQARWRKPQKN